jgi:peptidyl-prolyl cis-trans isomerase B (cyclophilin B)
MKNLFVISIFLLLCIPNLYAQTETTEKPVTAVDEKPVTKTNQRPTDDDKKKEPFDDADVKTMASQCVLMTTEKGGITLEMYPESAPETVRSFLNLVAIGALDTTTFSRIVKGFVIQGGDLYTSEKLTDKLKWRAVKTIPDEPNQILHEKGIISMARSSEPNSATTSFFILLGPAKTLDGTFAAFGKVIEGIETAEAINNMEAENEKPKEPVRITKAEVQPCAVKAEIPKTNETSGSSN